MKTPSQDSSQASKNVLGKTDLLTPNLLALYMDPIANLLTKIRNAQKASHESVTVPHSKIKEAIAKILQKEGFVGEVKVMTKDQFPEIKIMLKEGQELELTKVSKSGQRIYVKNDMIRKVKNGFGVSIMSTSQGIMTGTEARKKKIGGEFICTVS